MKQELSIVPTALKTAHSKIPENTFQFPGRMPPGTRTHSISTNYDLFIQAFAALGRMPSTYLFAALREQEKGKEAML